MNKMKKKTSLVYLVGKVIFIIVSLALYFMATGLIIGYSEKRVLKNAVREAIVEACAGTGGCYIKLNK